MVKIRVILPAQAPQQTVQPVPVTPASYLAYDESLRLSISSAGVQTKEWRSGKYGYLIGVTVFADNIDAGDNYSVTKNGRSLKGPIYPVANFSQEETFNESIGAGDRVTLYYTSMGTTVKNIDFTPRIKYDPSKNP